MQHLFGMHSSPLAEGGKTLVEYVWIGAGSQLRSRTKVFDEHPRSLENVPVISVDGRECGLAPEGGEVFLKPRKLFKDPFRGEGGHLLCLCDTFKVEQAFESGVPFSVQLPVLQPHPSNHRVPCEDLLARCRGSEATFTAEQEFAVLPSSPPCAPPSPIYSEPSSCMAPGSDVSASTLPFPSVPAPPSHEPPRKKQQTQQQAAHSVHAAGSNGRSVAEKHMQCCLRAGIKLTEVAQRSAPPYPPQPGSNPPVWSYQVGPLPGSELGDQVWMSRFLLLRVSEDEGLPVSFDPMHSGGLGRGLQCGMQYSTAATRRPGSGLNIIQQHMELLKAAHLQHSLAYGQAGGPTQLSACQFSVGVGSANGAVVIPSTTLLQQAGHFTDCRPCSNADPYLITTLLAATTHQLPLLAAPHRHVLQHTAKHAYGSASVGAPSQASQPSHCCDGDFEFDFDEEYDDDVASMNSEEVLIDELDRMDGMGPDTPPRHYGGLGCMLVEEGYDECCSDGSSPEVRCPWF